MADAAPGQDHTVELSIRGEGIAGDRTATAALDRQQAEDLGNDAAAIGACLSRGTPSPERIQAGERLFEAVFRDDVARLWAEAEELVAAGRPLRIRLDVRPGQLRALPWELLHDERDWVFLRQNLFAWRGAEPRPLAGDPETGPLRVLVVVCNPKDRGILADEELTVITGTLASRLGRTFVEIIDGPRLPKLSEEIDRLRPHVLHFIGHGMPRVGGSNPELSFNWVPEDGGDSDEPANPWELASDDISVLANWMPPTVIINACRTANDPLDPIGGFAEAFLAAGSRAVVSMQADIESPAAVLFSAALYQGLGDLAPLDETVAQARRQLRMKSGETGEWALPVLATSTDPADALRISFVPAESSISHICDRLEYGQLRGFLDRSPERRDAWWALDPQPAQPSARPLLVVGGQPVEQSRPGKTWFTRWCLLTCFLRGHRVTYVDLAEPLRRPDPDGAEIRQVKTKDWLDAIRAIREACISDRQLEPLQASSFDQFNASLNALVDGQAPSGEPAPAAADPVADQWRPFNNDRRHAQARTQQIYTGFLSALRQSADGRPHVIALDNADMILPEAFDASVYPGLIRPVAEDSRSVIRLVLVGSHEWLGQHLPQADDGLWASVHLAGFEATQYIRLARDYCHRRGLDFDKLRDIYEALGRMFQQTRAVVPVNAFAEPIKVFPAAYLAAQP